MIPIPPPIRVLLKEESPKAVCARKGEYCMGRLTVEHTYGRKQQERWQLIWLCWYHHLGGGLKKDMNRWIALNQATDADFDKYPRSAPAWKLEKKYLNTIYAPLNLS